MTPAGRLVADWARDVLVAATALDAGIRSLRADREVRLRVAASLTVAEHLLPAWLVRLAAQRPETAVSLHAMNSTDVARSVGDGGMDLGFVEGPRAPAGLSARVVASDELVVVTHPGHPWARRRAPIDAAELAATRLVQREPTSGTRHALETALRPYAPLAPPLLELSTTSAMRAAVTAGAGPAVLSNLAIDDDVAVGRLVRVPVVGVDLSRRLRAVWPAGQYPAGPARDLLAIAARRSRPPAEAPPAGPRRSGQRRPSG